MSTAEGTSRGTGKKRKHEDEGEEEAASPKRSKSSMRSERRRERLKGNPHTNTPRDTTASFGEHRIKEKSRREIKRDKRRRERDAAANGTLVEVTADVVPEDAVDYGAADEENERQREKTKTGQKKAARQRQQEDGASKVAKKQTESRRKSKPRAKATLSDPVAGRFIDHDPLFVRDAGGEGFLIAAVERELQVLSIETSLLVRTLPAPEGATIIGFAIESPDSNLIQVADSNGGMLVWDWTNDLPSRPMVSPLGSIKAIAAVRLNDDDEEAEVPYITQLDGLHHVKARDGELYETQKELQSILVLGKADYVVARGPNVVVIGMKKADKSYTWIELPLTRPAACMDARMLPPSVGSKKVSKRPPQLQLAIGHDDGQIHFYDDVSSLLSQGHQSTLPAPRILHWHRSAVSAVKFNPDGSYLLSGGKETVLVLWQLETGRKQYLPHLTSEIQHITVNVQGDRYALQMGDNSIIVLSTAELKPVAYFAGLQMQTSGSEGAHLPAAVVHPKNAKQLLIAVPETQPKSGNKPAPRPFLQTFDARTARHVTRQALTRNNATDLNVGPEGNAILPPDVVHLAISQDGTWLATVDEWMPPGSDLAHLASSRAGIKEARRSRREVYLKIWLWDASQDVWTLSTRADSPHHRAGSQSLGAGRVLALVSDPASNCFATIGEDSCVKLWRPKTRMRGGVAMKDAQDVKLVEWTCRRSVQLASNRARADSSRDTLATPNHAGAVAVFSNDGSLLAVSSSTPSTLDESVPAVTFIDTASGTVKLINTSLSDLTAIVGIAFLEPYFITVTHKAAFVRDLVRDTMVQKIKLPHTADSTPLLAVNETDQTFALVTPAEKEGKKSRVTVYTTRHTHWIYKQEFETGIVKILSGKGSREFVLLFADATLRTILPIGPTNSFALTADSKAASGPLTVGAEMDVEKSAADDDEVEGVGLVASSALKPEIEGVPAFEVDEDDRPVVRPEQLAAVLDGAETVRDMFHGVVGLFARKPR